MGNASKRRKQDFASLVFSVNEARAPTPRASRITIRCLIVLSPPQTKNQKPTTRASCLSHCLCRCLCRAFPVVKTFLVSETPCPATCLSRTCALQRSMTPTVLKKNSYRFFFFSREEARMHIHVSSESGEAKFWLEPELELAHNYRFSRQELKSIEIILEENYGEFISAWRHHFGD